MPNNGVMHEYHDVLVVGGGNAGISVAARLGKAGVTDVAIVEPADEHFYQPLWTLVGGGCVPSRKSRRTEASVIPRGMRWIRQHATQVLPDHSSVLLGDGRVVGYGSLVLCPGIQMNWDAIPGLADALESSHASSNYRYDLAPKTWELIRSLRSGKALFTAPSGAIKCGGAPQKIAYLAADHWRRQGVLDDIEITLVLPSTEIFSVDAFARTLDGVADSYGITVKLEHRLSGIDPVARTATFHSDAGEIVEEYDFAHFVPPQSAPDWIRESSVATPDDPCGYIEVDARTLQHPRHSNIFALGDAAGLPTSKTGAAIRKQAPVLVRNLVAQRAGETLPASYGGYSSCPLTTAKGKVVLAEFDYRSVPAPSFPLIDTTKERRDMWLLKRYGLPFLYWNLILRGKM